MNSILSKPRLSATMIPALVWILATLLTLTGLPAVAQETKKVNQQNPNPLSLLPAETLFLLHVPSMANLYERFLKGHLKSFDTPIVGKLKLAADKNPVLANLSRIPPAPGAASTNQGLAFMTTGGMAISMLPARQSDNLEFLAIALEPRNPQAAMGFRQMIAKENNGTWTEDKSTGVWTTKTNYGSLKFVQVENVFLVASHAESFQAALSALESNSSVKKSIADDALFQKTTAKHPGQPLIAYYSNSELTSKWLASNKNAALADLATLFKRRMAGLRCASWSWNSMGSGSIGHDHFVYLLDDDTTQALQQVIRPLNNRAVRLFDGEPLTTFRVNIDANKASELPAFAGLNGSSWLKDWGAVPGQGEFLYGVYTGDQPDTLQQGVFIGSNKTEALTQYVAKMSDKKGLRLPPIPTNWKARMRTDGLSLAPPSTNGKTLEKIKNDDTRPETRLENFAKRSEYSGSPPFLDYLIDRPKIMKRALALGQTKYSALADRLRKQGFKAPEKMPDITGLEDYYGMVRLTASLDGDALVVDTAIELTKSASTMLTSTAVTSAFAFKPEMLQTINHWEQAALPVEGKTSSTNLFNACCGSWVLISPILTDDNGPTLFIDLLAIHTLTSPPPKSR